MCTGLILVLIPKVLLFHDIKMLTTFKGWKILTHAIDFFVCFCTFPFENTYIQTVFLLCSCNHRYKVSFSLPWCNYQTFSNIHRVFMFASFNGLGFHLGDVYLILMIVWQCLRIMDPIFYPAQLNILLWLVSKSTIFRVN